MNWIKIDPNSLPKGEVLAANFEEHTFGYKCKLLGYLELQNGKVICDGEFQVLENITHYIDINQFDL